MFCTVDSFPCPIKFIPGFKTLELRHTRCQTRPPFCFNPSLNSHVNIFTVANGAPLSVRLYMEIKSRSSYETDFKSDMWFNRIFWRVKNLYKVQKLISSWNKEYGHMRNCFEGTVSISHGSLYFVSRWSHLLDFVQIFQFLYYQLTVNFLFKDGNQRKRNHW